MDTKNVSTFSIGQAAQRTGVSQNRLREWHDKGFLLDSQKISVGSRIHRRFTEKDIELINLIAKFQGEGFLLQVAAKRAKNKIQQKGE